MLNLLLCGLLLGRPGDAPRPPDAPRPFIYGCGITWGRWLGLPDNEARAFDRLSMDRVKAMGGTNVPANFAWIDIEPKRGQFDWSYVDHQVEEARKRGLEVFAYTGLTPDWALPPGAPQQPGIGYRFPPGEEYVPEFDSFFRMLAERYRGRVKYYEFWNEPNGCSWVNDGCSNGDMAPTYVPWLKRWHQAMKAGDPDCVLAVGGLDYHSGVTEGYRYLEDIYAAGGGPYFDAVAVHPYGDPLHWQAIRDTYAVLERHGDGHKTLWLNEYGWNTADEAAKARDLRTVLTELAKPEYHMVFQASYLVLTDLPGTDDGEGHDFGLCSRDRRAGTITPRASYEAFAAQPKVWVAQDAPARDRAAGPPRRGEIPPGFMLTFTDPGCEPGEPCDDVGPPRRIREHYIDQAGCNVGEFRISWRDTERENPGNGPSTYDFSKVGPSRRDRGKQYLICHLDSFGNGWSERIRYLYPERYAALLERWAEAACRFAREEYGCTIFETGGNERDLVAPETYQPHYPDWHFFYLAPIKCIHAGMKRAHPDNKLIIGNLCYSDRDHIGALYVAGAKGNFEILAIHAYGPRGCHVDMEQVIESHEEMAYRGDPDIPIILTEGWSSLPLPPSLEHDPVWRQGGRAYTAQEVEHFRQSVLDGWRNLTTPRPGEYDPSWVCGARYFVLNDHWGGRGWAARARPEYDDEGRLKGFHLDGYFIGTSDPSFINPLLRPWGLIDIEGRPKGDTVLEFPPYIPRHRFEARLAETLPRVRYCPRREELTAPEVVADRVYHAAVEFTNLEETPMTQFHLRLSEKLDADFRDGYGFAFEDGILRVHTDAEADRRVRARPAGGRPPEEVGPGQTAKLEYEVAFSADLARRREDGRRERIRPHVDAYYVWQGRPYHTDAWLPRVVVTPAGKGGSQQQDE